MTRNKTLQIIVNILRTLDEAGLLYSYNFPIHVAQGPLFGVTWPNHVSGASYFSKHMFGKIEQYKGILQNGAYHAIVKDGSIIKVAYFFDQYGTLVKHNLWYWPNPFAIPENDIQDHTPLDVLDLYASDWEKYVRFRTPLRFDYDQNGASANHSIAHLHMQTEECRIGVQEPICFANFIKFIFKNFYCQEWLLNNFWENLPLDFENNGNSLSSQQMLSIHLRWNKPIE